MSETHLTELPWKTLVVKQQIKDAGLGGALATYGKAGKEDHDARLKALDGIEKKAEGLQKDNKDKDDVVGYLDDVLKEVKKARKAIELQKGAGGDDEDDEEAEEYKKDLRKKLVAALAQVKSRAPGEAVPGEEGKPQLKFMAYVASGASAVVVARTVGPATKKLLPDIAGGAKGGKFVAGQCVYEKSCFTFVVEEAVGGMAKKMAKALLAETGNKYKVRIRTLDGAKVLDSDTDKDPDETATTATATATEPETETPAEIYKGRLKALLPGLQKALKEQRGDTSKMRAVMEFAREKADAGTYEAALKALDALEKLLIAAGVMASGAPATGQAPATGDDAGNAMLAWTAARSAAIAKLKAIAKQIADAKHAASAKALMELMAVIKQLTAEPSTPQQVAELEVYIRKDRVVGDVSELANDIRTPLLGALAGLKAKPAA